MVRSFASSLSTLRYITSGHIDVCLNGTEGHYPFLRDYGDFTQLLIPNFQLSLLGILGATGFGVKYWGKKALGTSAFSSSLDTVPPCASSKEWRLLSPPVAANLFIETSLEEVSLLPREEEIHSISYFDRPEGRKCQKGNLREHFQPPHPESPSFPDRREPSGLLSEPLVQTVIT